MVWPFGDRGTSQSGFEWGIAPDKRLLRIASKAGKRDAKKNPPKSGEWPQYLDQLLRDVRAATEKRAARLDVEMGPPRQDAEDILANYDEGRRASLLEAVHTMEALVLQFDHALTLSHTLRLSMQSSYRRALDEQLGTASWRPPKYVIEDPVEHLRGEVRGYAKRANAAVGSSGDESAKPFPDPDSRLKFDGAPLSDTEPASTNGG